MQTAQTSPTNPLQFHGPWAQMASGRPWPMIHPTAAHVHWPDIAEGLAKVCRFNGQCALFYSVAQHCCHVADLLPPPMRLHGLLHDAHEAITGDTIRPVKQALDHLRDPGEPDLLETLENVTTAAIMEAAGLPLYSDPAVEKAVKNADLVMLATEKRDLLAPSHLEWDPLPEPAAFQIKPWAWPQAEEEWLDRLNRYLPHGSRRA